MRTAEIPTNGKTNTHTKLQSIIDEVNKTKNPVYMVADWNARLINPTTEADNEIIGNAQYTEMETPS